MSKLDPKLQHTGLPDADLRDFLAKEYEKAYRDGARAFDGGEQAILEGIKKMEKELDATHRALAIRKIVEMKGWDFTDTSDHCAFSPEWFMFLGTKEELATRFPELAASRED